MKRKGIRVALALVLSLVLILGSVSIAAAKGNPHRTATLTPHATLGGATYDLSFDLSFNAYRIQRISYCWYYKDAGNWTAWEPENPSFTFIKATRSWSGTFSYYDYNPQDVAAGSEWMISVVLYKPKGKDYVPVVFLDETIVVGS